VAEFLSWCDDNGLRSITAVQQLHVAAWIAMQQRDHAAPIVKAQLAALRHLFDWLVTGQVVPVNLASSVRGPSHTMKIGKTPVLVPEEVRAHIAGDPKGPLFTTIGRGTGMLRRAPQPARNTHAMIRRRAATAGIQTILGNGIVTLTRSGSRA
jgi:site-specific recombinase XerD